MRSGIELEVEELAEQIAQPPPMESIAEALFARVDDYRRNMADGLPVNSTQLRMTCEALCSTVDVMAHERTVARNRNS